MFQSPTFLPHSHNHHAMPALHQPHAGLADLKRQTALISPSLLPLILAACGAGSGGGGQAGPAAVAVSFAEADLSVRLEEATYLGEAHLFNAEADGGTGEITYSIEGEGFRINEVTGEVNFASSFPFRNPDQAYQVQITATDSRQQSATQQVTFVIERDNDAPILGYDDILLSEGDSSASITITLEDPEGHEASFTQSEFIGQYGALTVSPDQKLIYTPTDFDSIHALGGGDMLQEQIAVFVSDSVGAEQLYLIDVIITGIDDAPQIEDLTFHQISYELAGEPQGALLQNPEQDGHIQLVDGTLLIAADQGQNLHVNQLLAEFSLQDSDGGNDATSFAIFDNRSGEEQPTSLFTLSFDEVSAAYQLRTASALDIEEVNDFTVTVQHKHHTDVSFTFDVSVKPAFYGTNDADLHALAEGVTLAYGGAGADAITGTSLADILYGGTGGDSLFGGAEADTLYGGDGHDDLQGEAGHDRFIGGLGDDVITLGAGDDIIFYEEGDGVDTISDFGRDGSDMIYLYGFDSAALAFASISDASAYGRLSTSNDGLLHDTILYHDKDGDSLLDTGEALMIIEDLSSATLDITAMSDEFQDAFLSLTVPEMI